MTTTCVPCQKGKQHKASCKAKDVTEFCGLKGIKREYSNARTPQQNGVAERKNRTLIEAARTMLADSFLPNTFWDASSTKDKIDAGDSEKKMNLLKTALNSNIDGGPRERNKSILKSLARLQRQEKEANEEAEALRKNLEQETENLVLLRKELLSLAMRGAGGYFTQIMETVDDLSPISHIKNNPSYPIKTISRRSDIQQYK
ncbi:ribonuclease H-like domain-containing protein [Tanacetum coccineum]